jgi:hypothetical protein
MKRACKAANAASSTKVAMRRKVATRRKGAASRKLAIAAATLLGAALVLAGSPALALSGKETSTLDRDDLGYVSDGGSLSYSHQMEAFNDPSIDVTSVESSWLSVMVVDDWACRSLRGCVGDWFFETEVASIDLNSVEWVEGRATAQLFAGNVTAEAGLFENDGLLEVTVNSEDGDFMVVWSALTMEYAYELADTGGSGSGGPGMAMPEPSAALVFAMGALVVHGRLRRTGRARDSESR